MRRWLGHTASRAQSARRLADGAVQTARGACAIRACSSVSRNEHGPPPGSTAAPSSPLRHPMEWLSMVFQQHPSALKLHRELTIALAEGDSERAADLASVLAAAVRRASEALEAAPSTADNASADTAQRAGDDDSLPPPLSEDVQEAVEKTREALESAHQRSSRTSVDGSAPRRLVALRTPPASTDEAPFWRDPESLCVTLLESAFEADVPYENASPLSEEGLRAEAHERQEMEILDAYLSKEAVRWKEQKAAVLRAVLDVAKRLGLTPEEIHVHESTRQPRRDTEAEVHLNVLKHANLLIRGEVPALAFGSHARDENSAPSSPSVLSAAKAELSVLKARMAQQGTPLSTAEEEMALYELVLSKSTMRYLVGLHHDLEAAINSSAGVRRAWETTDESSRARSPTPAAFFVSCVMAKLHPSLALNDVLETDTPSSSHGQGTTQEDTSSAEEALELNRVIASPVLPFTFMLKTCLWFNTDGRVRGA